MNAVRLYVSAARLILENDHYDYTTCKQIQNVFPSLDQSLTCTVCRHILKDPYSPPVESSCQHHVCRNCVGGLKKLKPACSWCKDYDKYTKNTQLYSLLECYKGLCYYIKCTNLLTQLADFCSLANNAAPKTTIDHYLTSRSHIKSEFGCSMVRYINNALNETNREDVTAIKIENSSDKSLRSADSKRSDSATIKIMYPASRLRSGIDDSQTQRLNGNDHNSDHRRTPSYSNSSKRLYSVAFAGSEGARNKLILRRKTAPLRIRPNEQFLVKRSNAMAGQSQFPSQHGSNNLSGESNLQYKPSTTILRNNADRPSCKCGNATSKPGKLTCCGQRCACYMQSKACAGCKCRGCRNPHMVDGVKILRRFVRDRHHQNTNPSMVMTNNSSGFENLSANFLNKSSNQVFSNAPHGTVSNMI